MTSAEKDWAVGLVQILAKAHKRIQENRHIFIASSVRSDITHIEPFRNFSLRYNPFTSL